jgi:molybdate transport system substrate-binding protein
MKRWLVALMFITLATGARGDPLRMAVAANFQDTFETLSTAYAAAGGEPIEASYGATGMLYTQIVNGAPFDALFAADDARTQQLVADGRARPASRFIYALGHLALWVPAASTPPGPDWLAADSNRVAIANPELAPYGHAAQETLAALQLWDSVQPRLVTGTSVGQTFQFIASAGVPGGVVARAQLISYFHGTPDEAKVWDVPERLHTPIVQEAVALNTPAAERVEAFFAFVVSADGRAIIERGGYSALAPIKTPPQ